MDPNSAYAAAQHAQRIGGLEDLLRRNESTVSILLGRAKESELALNTFARQVQKLGSDVQLSLEDLGNSKRRLDAVDVAWRTKAKDVDTAIDYLRAQKPPPLNADPLFQRLAQDVMAMRQEVTEVAQHVRRLSDSHAADSKALRQLETDTRWITEQLRDTVASQREFASQSTRKAEQLQMSLAEVKQEHEKSATQLRLVMDAVVKALREELVVRLDLEGRARGALQGDFVAAFAQMRDDVVKGFSQTATNIRNLDETAHSLETVLRAEVRSRLAGLDGVSRRLETCEEKVRRESVAAAEYLKALDGQMSAALRDVRDITAAECKSQLDRVWRSIAELNEHTVKKGSVESVNSDDLHNRRAEMLLEARLEKMNAETLDAVDLRLTTALVGLNSCVSKAELKEQRDSVDLRMEELQRQIHKQSNKQVRIASAAAGDEGSPRREDSLKVLEKRIGESERRVLTVAEAVREVHDDLAEKVTRVEQQTAAVDGLQRALQTTFERDQRQMEEHLRTIREQVIVALQATDQAAQSASGGAPQATEGDGAANATAPAGERAAVLSPSLVASHSMIEAQLGNVKENLRTLETDVRGRLVTLTAEVAAVTERHNGATRSQTDSHNRLHDEVVRLAQQSSENEAQLRDGLERLSATCTSNFAAFEDELRSTRLEFAGKSVVRRTDDGNASAANAAPHPAADEDAIVRKTLREVETTWMPRAVNESVRRVESELIVPLRRDVAELQQQRGGAAPPPAGTVNSPKQSPRHQQPPAAAPPPAGPTEPAAPRASEPQGAAPAPDKANEGNPPAASNPPPPPHDSTQVSLPTTTDPSPESTQTKRPAADTPEGNQKID